ncbi:hypothetical protein D3C72_1710150 [compost metagenome]
MAEAVENPAHVVHFGLHLWPPAEVGQLRLPDLPHLELFTEQQHGQLGSLLERDFLELPQRVSVGDYKLQFIFVQQQTMQAWLAWRQVTDADVQAAIEQAAFDLQARQLVDLHHQMRLGLAHPVEQLWHQARAYGLQDANGQGPQGLALEVAQGFAGALQTVEQGQGMVVQGVCGEGRQQALVAPLEQADIQAVFELADLL